MARYSRILDLGILAVRPTAQSIRRSVGGIFRRKDPSGEQLPAASGMRRCSALPPIIREADWPPARPALDFDAFAGLTVEGRETVAAVLEIPVCRLRESVDRILERPAPHVAAATRVARAMAACMTEIAGLIEAVDHLNNDPGSPYRIEPDLTGFLVECAVREVADSSAERIGGATPAELPAAA